MNAAQRLAETRRHEPQQAVERPPAADEGSRETPSVIGSAPYVGLETREVSELGEGYGPVRVTRRVSSKRPPVELHRPLETQADEFLELMQEVVPRLITQTTASQAPIPEPSAASGLVRHHPDSPRGSSQKRAASQEHQEAPVSAIPRASNAPEHEGDEALTVEIDGQGSRSRVEVLLAAFMHTRMQKELPATGNDPSLQSRIDEAKGIEWETVTGKSAARAWTGAKARDIRQKQAHRFVGSRFVITEKVGEEGTRVKARWRLQGHSDPDFREKISSGLCHSPTLSHLGRAVLLQLLVSNHWTMHLGDIKGAFMEAGPFRPLYAHQPPGGIPGLHPDDVVEITGNLYESNDAPFQWFRTFDQVRGQGSRVQT